MIFRLFVRRLPLAMITLVVLSLIVFFGGQLLPGDVGRAVLGPLADARAVAAFDHQIGVDRPLLVQYWDWISHFVAFVWRVAFRRDRADADGLQIRRTWP